MFKDIFIPGFLVTALSACSTAPAQPTINQEPSSANSIGTFVPTPTPTELFPGLHSIDLLTPAVRSAALAATQQAFTAKDAQTLQREGFPEDIKGSQNTINNEYTVLATVGNTPETSFDYAAGMNLTMVNMDKTPYAGFILVITAGHGFSTDNIIMPKAKASLQQNSGIQKVTIKEANLTGITLNEDRTPISLRRNQFGLDSLFKSSKLSIYTDYGFVMIPKTNISPDVLAQIQKDAIPAGSISFTPFSADDKVYALCTPHETKTTTVIAEGAKYMGNSGNVAAIGPSLTRTGCSGSGFFSLDASTLLKLKGIGVAEDALEQNFNLESFVYPFSAMGEGEFWASVDRATHDPNLAK